MTPYGPVAAVLGSLGSGSLAVVVRARFAVLRSGPFLPVYAAVLACVVVPGAFVLPIAWAGHRWSLAVAIPLGLVAGEAARLADRAVVRRLLRRRQPITPPSAGESRLTGVRPAGVGAAAPAPPRDPPAGPGRAAESGRAADTAFGLGWTLLVAVLEELAHRGLVVAACLRLHPASAAAAALLGAACWFGLLHLPFGWAHVAGKVPLGLLATAAALGAGTVFAAVVAHLWFNLRTWSETRTASAGTP
jgi:hypothetical protein